MAKPVEGGPPTPEESTRIILADRAAREKRAHERIEKVLAEERVQMIPMFVFSPGNLSARIEFKAKD